jgi:hypothetical protein
MRLVGAVSRRPYEYRGSILLVSAATRARRTPETAVDVGAVVGVSSVSRKLLDADVGARFGPVRSKHGWPNRKGPRGSRHARASVQRASRAPRAVWVPCGLESCMGHTKCTHPVGACASNCASRVRVW